MKIDFYTDVYPGVVPGNLFASQSPGAKSDGSKRYRISVTIPDHAFTGEVDGQAVVEETKEVDKN
ncbi:MAG: hypothetical protein V7677_10460 [Motiliproteus sp.]